MTLDPAPVMTRLPGLDLPLRPLVKKILVVFSETIFNILRLTVARRDVFTIQGS